MSNRKEIQGIIEQYVEAINGVVVEGAVFFRFRDGKICYDQGFFDTRRLMAGER